MKVVLRHKITGRYYCGNGRWVRRSDNALVFDNVSAAMAFTRRNRLAKAQPVQRLAPYVAALLSGRQEAESRHKVEAPAAHPKRFAQN